MNEVEYAVNEDLTYTVWYGDKIIGMVDPIGEDVRQVYIYEDGEFILKHTFLFPEDAYEYLCSLVENEQ
jgi:hypothetical protein